MRYSDPGRLSSCLENPRTLALPLRISPEPASPQSAFTCLGSHTPRRTPFRPIAIVCRISCANDFLQARPPSSPFEGREDGLDVSDRRLLPDSSTTSTRASSVPVRVSSHGAFDVFTTSLALRRVIQKVRGEFSSPDCALRFEVPHLTTTEPLTPLSLPSIRGVALGAQSRARRRLPRPLLQPARETQAAFTIRGAFPRLVAHRAPSGPRFRDGRSRPATRQSHDFAAVVRRKRRRFARPLPEGNLSPCEDADPEETDALRETLQRVATLFRARGLGPRSRRGTSSVEWCARRFSGPRRRRTTSATIPARFRAVPSSLVRNWADARAHPFERSILARKTEPEGAARVPALPRSPGESKASHLHSSWGVLLRRFRRRSPSSTIHPCGWDECRWVRRPE
jgi:hypothetical protein